MEDFPSLPDHGGNLAEARARYGGMLEDWLDLSTGINPVPYPTGSITEQAWTRLPDRDLSDVFNEAARDAYEVPSGATVLAAPGASSLIRLMPRLRTAGRVAIPMPTYNEHARAFACEGWQISQRPEPATTAAVIVNPNNPDGRIWEPEELLVMADALPLLIVDESFMDVVPERSLIPEAGRKGLVVLRSFGKFYGLAGLRLGAAIGHVDDITRLTQLLGPWPVSGPALEIGARALSDTSWADKTRRRIAEDGDRLARLGQSVGWQVVGGAGLFTTFDVGDAPVTQDNLASRHIWSRIFPYSRRWLRLGLPANQVGWERLTQAVGG